MGILKRILGKSSNQKYPADFSNELIKIIEEVKPYTMTSDLRLQALYESVRYIEKNNIEGSIVECGVWRGGSTMAAIKTLMNNSNIQREIYLYDTFEGMSEPDDNDKTYFGKEAQELMEKHDKSQSDSVWCVASLEEVTHNIQKLGYPHEKVRYIKGKVEDTLNEVIPSEIAILRLDTDWYQSTKKELEVLFPKLVSGGVLIIDDYGHWEGAKKAVDEYFENNKIKILLNRIDYTGRIAIKQ